MSKSTVFFIALVLTLLTLSAARSQDEGRVKIRFKAYPPDTKIFLRGATTSDYLGAASEVLEIPKAWLDQKCDFVFKRAGYSFAEAGWTPESNRPGKSKDGILEFPAGTTLTGRANNAMIDIAVGIFFNPLPFLLGFTLLAGGGLYWLQGRRERGTLQALQRKREALAAHFDGSDPLVGKTLGKYLVIDRLGEGGMATVYKAVPEATLELKDTVAIKIMQAKMADDPEFRRRFQREVQVSKDLQHPNIVRVDDWGEQDGMLYLVLEYVPGETLERRIPRQGMSLEEALPYLEPIVEALIYAHGRGVVHRDLKPENIMVTKMGALKVMDFGLARSNDVSKVTKTGSALGTPAYMPPEQITGAAPRPASDQYAFGVMTYEILTGRRPFDDGDMMSILFKHMSERPPSPREWKPSISEGMEELILRMLEKEPNRRLPSMELVREGLQALAAGRLWAPPAMPPGPPPRKPPAQASISGDPAALAEGPSSISDTPLPQKEAGGADPAERGPVTEGGTVAVPLVPPGQAQGDSTVGFQALPPDSEGALQAISPQTNEGTVGFQALPPQGQPGSDGTVAFQALAVGEEKKEGD